jgi:hypothetical protein
VGISTSVTAGTYSVHVSATDAESNANGSDPNFTSGDLSSDPQIVVATPTAPVVTVNSVSPNPVSGGTTVTVNWQSTQTGTYQVRAGAGAACSSGTLVDNGSVSAAGTPANSTFSSNVLSEGSNNIAVCVTNAEPTQG